MVIATFFVSFHIRFIVVRFAFYGGLGGGFPAFSVLVSVFIAARCNCFNRCFCRSFVNFARALQRIVQGYVALLLGEKVEVPEGILDLPDLVCERGRPQTVPAVL